MMNETSSEAAAPKWVKPVTDYVPVALFLAAYYLYDIITAAAVLVAATMVALAVSWTFARRTPWLPLIAAVIVSVFGGLTYWLNDDFFIKIKPTVMQILFAAILMGGVAFKKLWLKMLIGGAWPMPDAAWRALTKRFAVFFLIMAAANEVVWRSFSTDTWVLFDNVLQIGITMTFMASQIPFMNRHHEGEHE